MTLNHLCAIPFLLVYALVVILPVTLPHVICTAAFNVALWLWLQSWRGFIGLLVLSGFAQRADFRPHEIEVPPDGQA